MAFTYRHAIAAIDSAAKFGIHPSLDTITAMTRALGEPQKAYTCVQVTGTNGKSSTSRMIAALLSAEGQESVGLYTSPELLSYTERIEIDGRAVSEEEFATGIEAAVLAAKTAGVQPTEFELLTAAALWLYREKGVGIAVLEAGMGGKWDATSVVVPDVSVITGVGLDHMEFLGPTLEAIATDKSHIIKDRSRTVLGPGTRGLEEIFVERAKIMGGDCVAVRPIGTTTPCPESSTARFAITKRPDSPKGCTTVKVEGVMASYGEITILAPAYQAANVATAITAAEVLRQRALDRLAVASALGATSVPGRFQCVAKDPHVIIDGAHNPQAAVVLADSMRDAWPDPENRPVVVLGVLADKDAKGIVSALARVACGFVCVTPDSPRALDAEALAGTVHRLTGMKPRIADSVASALDLMHAEGKRDIVVTGSLRTVAEGLLWSHSRQRP